MSRVFQHRHDITTNVLSDPVRSGSDLPNLGAQIIDPTLEVIPQSGCGCFRTFGFGHHLGDSLFTGCNV